MDRPLHDITTDDRSTSSTRRGHRRRRGAREIDLDVMRHTRAARPAARFRGSPRPTRLY